LKFFSENWTPKVFIEGPLKGLRKRFEERRGAGVENLRVAQKKKKKKPPKKPLKKTQKKNAKKKPKKNQHKPPNPKPVLQGK